MIMTSLHLVLLLSILLCSLVAGLLFAFAVVVMPGIAKLPDKEFLSSFKYMDGIIQDDQPLFILVWAGSILSVISTLILGTLNLDGTELYLLWIASVLYLFGVQLPTFRFNIPLNNLLQNMDVQALGESELTSLRDDFEIPWNRWNRLRTVNCILSVSVLLILLIQL
jgi:uncharacterized membrane protein